MVRGSDVLLILVSSFLAHSTEYSPRSQIAILFPPAAVGFMTGCSCDLLINVLLTRMSPLLLSFVLNTNDVFQSLATSLGTSGNLSKLSPTLTHHQQSHPRILGDLQEDESKCSLVTTEG